MSVMKCARNRTTCARYASGEVRCDIVVSVVISICVIELSVPVFQIAVLILLVVILYQFIPLFSRGHFSHMFSLYSHGILGVELTEFVMTDSCVTFIQKIVCLCSSSRVLICAFELIHSSGCPDRSTISPSGCP